MHTHRANRFSTTTLAEVAGIGLSLLFLGPAGCSGSNVKINEVDVGGRLVAPTAN